MDLIGGIIMVIGSLLPLLAGVGAVKFDDFYARMHAAAKAPVLGLIVIGIGVVVAAPSWSTAIIIGLVVVLQLVASPVGSHMIARSVYVRMRPEFDAVDQFAEDRAEADADVAETAQPSDTDPIVRPD